VLVLCGGNYIASEIWSGFTPINLPSHTTSTRFPTREHSRIASASSV